jgi:hypothetical protein
MQSAKFSSRRYRPLKGLGFVDAVSEQRLGAGGDILPDLIRNLGRKEQRENDRK